MLTISIEPTHEFNNRSGMATSTRNKAMELWRTALPQGNKEQVAKILFSYENPPGTKEVAGSQDAIGIVYPGLNRLEYNAGYWPYAIESVHDEEVLAWLERMAQLAVRQGVHLARLQQKDGRDLELVFASAALAFPADRLLDERSANEILIAALARAVEADPDQNGRRLIVGLYRELAGETEPDPPEPPTEGHTGQRVTFVLPTSVTMHPLGR